MGVKGVNVEMDVEMTDQVHVCVSVVLLLSFKCALVCLCPEMQSNRTVYQIDRIQGREWEISPFKQQKDAFLVNQQKNPLGSCDRLSAL